MLLSPFAAPHLQSAAPGIAAYLRLIVPALLIAAAGAATLLAWRRRPAAHRPRLWALAATAAFVLLDWGLATALAPLGLSFGPVEPILLYLWSLRGIFFLPFLVPSLKRRKRPARPAGLIVHWALNLILLAGTLDAFYVEPFALGVTRVELEVPGLTRPLRIVQISDLHVERRTPRERALVPLVESLQPDLIVLTGDYVNLGYLQDPLARSEARAVISQLHAPQGVYAVAGTVDADTMDDLFRGTAITVLDDAIAPVICDGQTLSLIGVYGAWDRPFSADRAALLRLAPQVPAEHFSILLYHTPDLIAEAAAQGIDLYLAGHTHGGQVRLPFYGALATASDYGKQYEMGRYQVGGTTLFVSRGLGMEGFWVTPRVRFLCPPEVVLIELRPVSE